MRELCAPRDTPIECLTLYAFSSENWKRPEEEVDDLMNLMRKFIKSDLPEFIANDVRLHILGDWRALAPDIVAMLEDAIAQTAKGTRTLAVALNYGAHAEIVHAARKAAAEGEIDSRQSNSTCSMRNCRRSTCDPHQRRGAPSIF